jgi:hypothetical protein
MVLFARRHWAYPVMVGLPVVGRVAILVSGGGLHAPPALTAFASGASVTPINATLRVPVFLAQSSCSCLRLVGKALRSIGQPQVVGEMVAGLLLGPSILGWVSPGAYQLLFPLGTVRFLSAVR